VKKIILSILIGTILLAAGCTRNNDLKVEPTSLVTPTKKEKKAPQGIAFNKIKFEKIKDSDAPKELVDKIEKLKRERGFAFTVDDKSGYIYIAVFMGEKPTGGYSIEVTDVSDSEGRTGVLVKEIEPNKGDIVTQVLTQPYTIIKAKGITTNISVENDKGETFKKL
jgi:hypothetical protein